VELCDSEIIARVQQGEREQFLFLFDRYYSRVERYARRHLKNGEEARDVASETFLRAYRNVDSFRQGERISYLGYLFLICRRLILTEQQRFRLVPIALFEDAGVADVDTLAGTEVLPLAHLLEGERRVMIRQALERLPAQDREIIYLAFERDLSRRDIMRILEKPSISAVTSHLYRALQRLKAVLIRQGYFTAELEAEGM
jgi:RNA polymerase sigma-70 factor (ECF subfamily)